MTDPPCFQRSKRASTRAWRGGLAACLLLLGGCAGYQVGTESLYAPHIRTVHVPIFQSDSYRRNLGERLTEAVMKEIEGKTPFKVVGTPNADSTLIGRISAESKRVVVENPTDDPREAEVRMHVRVQWVDHRGNLLREMEPIPVDASIVGVSGTAAFFPEVGQSVATAHQKAIQRIADQVVAMMETPW